MSMESLAEIFGVRALVEARSYTAALEQLAPALYGDDTARRVQAVELRDLLFAALKEAMRTATHPPKTRMKFGTSGWRGLLLEDFTLHNVGCVTRGLIETLLDPSTHGDLGVASADELRARGCVIAHDTRIMGPEFAELAARILLVQGVRVYYLGMATTPEVSAALYELNAAFSINFTPSHNPFAYHGYKFNPADGGPATKELTAPVAQRANEIIDQALGFTALSDADWEAARRDPARYQVCDPMGLYIQSVKKRLPALDPEAITARLNQADIEVFVDNGFGASTGKYERLFAGLRPGKLHVYHHTQDYLFGGKNREPSVENFRGLQAEMRKSTARLAVGFMNDGDGDRFVGGGREAVLVMNKFGPLVVRYLTQSLKESGDVTRSVMTSHMADAAQQRYCPGGTLHETAVGFQFLKGFIPGSVNSWEESDGMSPKGWSRDKDGLMAALLLTAMVLDEGKSAEELLAATEEELGPFYFERQKVAGKLQGDALSSALKARFDVAEGTRVSIGGREFGVARVVRLDGTKIILDNGWWFGVRASGTEPVVRPYVETFAPAGADATAREEARAWQQRIMSWLKEEITKVVS